MPIHVESDIRRFNHAEFHSLAHRVLGITFDVHNDLGRLMDEAIYKQAIAIRCADARIAPVQREVRITLRFEGFEKLYAMDLLLDFGLMVEVKTVESLSSAHFSQTLQYLLLTGMSHGLLVNLRQESVIHKFVSTTLDLAERRRIVIRDVDWRPIDEPSLQLHKFVTGLLTDWGAFLQVDLYRQAIVHHLGGPERAFRKVTVFDGDRVLGTDLACMISEDIALTITALAKCKAQMRDHLQRYLSHTRLAGIQWINLNHHDIEFTTLRQ